MDSALLNLYVPNPKHRKLTPPKSTSRTTKAINDGVVTNLRGRYTVIAEKVTESLVPCIAEMLNNEFAFSVQMRDKSDSVCVVLACYNLNKDCNLWVFPLENSTANKAAFDLSQIQLCKDEKQNFISEESLCELFECASSVVPFKMNSWIGISSGDFLLAIDSASATSLTQINQLQSKFYELITEYSRTVTTTATSAMATANTTATTIVATTTSSTKAISKQIKDILSTRKTSLPMSLSACVLPVLLKDEQPEARNFMAEVKMQASEEQKRYLSNWLYFMERFIDKSLSPELMKIWEMSKNNEDTVFAKAISITDKNFDYDYVMIFVLLNRRTPDTMG